MTVRVLVVDDSPIVRQIFSRELSRDPEINVVGTARDGYDARDKIAQLKPDVLTLDVEMPRMDGITFLRGLMRYNPIPAVIVSSLTPRGSELAFAALDAGGVDILCKPHADFRLPELSVQLIEKCKAAARVRLDRLPRAGDKEAASSTVRIAHARRSVVAIGASTGGPRALQRIIGALPANSPGILVVQHMPVQFTKAFAQRLDQYSALRVKETEPGDVLVPGQVLVAPGNRHLLLKAGSHGELEVELKGGPLVCRHRPSVDVLFKSVARHAGDRSVGVILTGMGNDGAQGLLEMKHAGAWTVAQDEESSVVYGMPKSAAKIEAMHHTVSLDDIAATIARLVSA